MGHKGRTFGQRAKGNVKHGSYSGIKCHCDCFRSGCRCVDNKTVRTSPMVADWDGPKLNTDKPLWHNDKLGEVETQMAREVLYEERKVLLAALEENARKLGLFPDGYYCDY